MTVKEPKTSVRSIAEVMFRHNSYSEVSTLSGTKVLSLVVHSIGLYLGKVITAELRKIGSN